TRETLQRYLEILLGEEDSFRRSQEARLKLETIIVRMAYLEPVIPLGDILSTIENIEQKLQRGLVAENSGEQEASEPPIKMPAASVGPIPGNDAAAIEVPGKYRPQEARAINPANPGNDFKNFIRRENPILGAKIASAEAVDFMDGSLTLSFPKGYIFLEDISAKDQKEQLKQIAEEFFSQEVTVDITTIDVDKARVNSNNGRKAGSVNDIKREAMNHPLLQKVLDEFAGAEIVDIKTRTEKKQEV
ncbi:MAG: hypothetical protein ABRQ29_10340, partial [Smithellaceae bacterium]